MAQPPPSIDPRLPHPPLAGDDGLIVYARWSTRVLAAIIDSLIISIPGYVLMDLLGLGYGAVPQPAADPLTGIPQIDSSFFVNMFVSTLILAAFGITYFAYLHGTKGQTIGKMAMKIKVVDESHMENLIGIGRAAVRAAVPYGLAMLLYIPAIIDVLMPLWDERSQSIHDKVAKSVVIAAT